MMVKNDGKKKKVKKKKVRKRFRWGKRDDPHEKLLSRFVVLQTGEQAGESIGVESAPKGLEGQRLIIKKGNDFYSIPLDAVQKQDEDLVIIDDIDWAMAEALGEGWRKKAFNVIETDEGEEEEGEPKAEVAEAENKGKKRKKVSKVSKNNSKSKSKSMNEKKE